MGVTNHLTGKYWKHYEVAACSWASWASQSLFVRNLCLPGTFSWPFQFGTVEGWSQSNFFECGQTACGKVATTGSQQGHSNPSKHKGIAFIWRIQSTIITNTREPTPRTADYSSASTALHYKRSFCHNGLNWEGVRLSERRKQWKEKK